MKLMARGSFIKTVIKNQSQYLLNEIFSENLMEMKHNINSGQISVFFLPNKLDNNQIPRASDSVIILNTVHCLLF